MKTLCICVLRNGLSMTKPAVASILAQTEPCDILLIDNASSDGTAQWMQTLRHPIACSFHREQIPLAAAWNQGLQSAFTHGYDAAWVPNNDVLFRPDTLHWLNADPRPFVTGVGVNSLDQLNADLGPNPSARSNAHPAFSCFRMTREVWEKVGGFNEEYIGGYVEDVEFDTRMRQAGIVAVSISVPFLHYGSATIINSDPVEKHRISVNAARNRKRYKDVWGVEPGSPEYHALLERLCPAPIEDIPITFPSQNEQPHDTEHIAT